MSSTNFQELNLSNGFLFPAALEDPITCRLVLECIIEEKVEELEIRVEYTKNYNSEFKCIRLDVYAKDAVTKISYNMEMQNRNEHNLPLRSRYYQAQIDMGNLEPGMEYTDLKPVYIIFICNFDPFDKELYRYTFSMKCEESELMLNDGAKRIFLNTKGKNMSDVPQILLDFLGYLNNSTDEYVQEKSSDKIKEIHGRIKEMKKNRDVEARYMHYLYVDKLIKEKEDKLQQKEAELQQKDTELQQKDTELQQKDTELQQKDIQLQQTIKELLYIAIETLGEVSEVVRERIKREKDVSVLKSMHNVALKSNSIKQFEDKIANL